VSAEPRHFERGDRVRWHTWDGNWCPVVVNEWSKSGRRIQIRGAHGFSYVKPEKLERVSDE
jgi:hypothetical protein